MNQKNMFMIIGVILVLQGIAFYTMGDKVVSDAFPALVDDLGKSAAVTLMTVLAMLSIAIGLIAYAARNSPDVVWAFALGFGLLSLNSLKHKFIDGINVPIPALIIQLLITLVCLYLWMQSRKAPAS